MFQLVRENKIIKESLGALIIRGDQAKEVKEILMNTAGLDKLVSKIDDSKNIIIFWASFVKKIIVDWLYEKAEVVLSSATFFSPLNEKVIAR